MVALTNSKVYRGGVTSPYLSNEITSVHASAQEDGSSSITTSIASKGGGETYIRIELSAEDTRALVAEVVDAGGMAGVFWLLDLAQNSLRRIKRQSVSLLRAEEQALSETAGQVESLRDRFTMSELGLDRWRKLFNISHSLGSVESGLRDLRDLFFMQKKR